MKEHKDIGTVKGQHGETLRIVTVIFSIVKGAKQKMAYGIRLELEKNQHTSAAFLDLDELPELIEAFDFIIELAPRMLREPRDYTEITYATKDDATFGFYQTDDQQQQAFTVLQAHGDQFFTSVDKLASIRQTIIDTKTHLVSRGATLED